MIRYDVRSPRADDFINHQEILDTLAYAAMHRHDAALARSILEKARANLTPAHDHGTTLTHREASVLLACEDPEVNAEIRNYENMLDVLEGTKRARGVRVVIPYDL